MNGRRLLAPICTTLLVAVLLQAQAQQSNPDSLSASIGRYPQNDTIKVGMMTTLSKMLAYSDPSRAMKIADDALPIAQKLRFKAGILNAYNLKSSLYVIQGNLQQALIVCNQYQQLARQYQSAQALITANGLLGIIYSQKGDYAQALEYLLSALRVADSTGDPVRVAAITQNIGNIYNDLEDYDKAIEYYQKSISITAAGAGVPPSLYNNIGSVLIHQHQYAKAIEYLEKGKALSASANNKRSLAGALTNLSDAYHNLGDNDKAFDYGSQALQVSRAIGDKRTMANSLMNVGIAISALPAEDLQTRGIKPEDRFNIASLKLDSALALAAAVGDMATRDEAYKDLSDVCAEKQDYPAALSAMRLYSRLRDTIVNNDNQKEITRKFIQYDFDKKAADLKVAQLQAQQQLNIEQKDLALSNKDLALSNKDLALSNKDRDLQHLTAQKEQEDLLKEKREKENILVLAEQKDKINTLEVAGQKRLRYGLIAGLVLLFVIGGLIFRQSIQRSRANRALTIVNKRLDEANKVKARFFGVLSHDLRSPIARLINFLYLQKEAPDLLVGDNAAKHTQRIFTSAEDLLATIEDLLLWSKSQMDKFKPDIRPVPVQEVFEDLKRLYPGGGQLDIDFTESSVFELETDKYYLITILRNLTANAMKALQGQTDGHITWTAYETQGKKYLSIRDNGPGMSKERQQVLFNDDASIGTKNGLGLNFVRDFAAAIHCDIGVESAPGAGTTFTLGFFTSG